MDPAFGLLLARPAALAPVARLGAAGTADRRVAAVVERVIGKVVLVDIAPDVALAPVGEGVQLPDPAAFVVLELGGRRPGRRLLAAHAGDPCVNVGQSLLERVDL